MKNTMMFAIMIMAAIILMVAFDIKIWPNHAVTTVSELGPNMLFVCPGAASPWDEIANGLAQLKEPIKVGFFFATMLLVAIWGWAMYQSLLKDKFNRDTFKSPWAYTKLLFWASMVMILLVHTPNYFRSVRVDGTSGSFVMCDGGTPGARAVPASRVEPMRGWAY